MARNRGPNPWVVNQYATNQPWQRQFLHNIGLEDVEVKFLADPMTMKQLMLWRGRGGVVFRHYFEWDAASCSDDEIAAIKVKVKMSTC